MESCLYEGVVHHERFRPVTHRFSYRMSMNFLDLAEVSCLMRAGLLSESRFSPNGFIRRDHFGDPRQPLAASVRDLVRQETNMILDGPIVLLTQLRFGLYFSPLNLFYCYAPCAKAIKAVVAEVQNTPWLERHCYVLWEGNQVGAGAETHFQHAKAFHVSPFMGMDVDYRWRVSAPAESLQVGIENTQAGMPLFQAALRMRRVRLSRRSQWAMHCRYPLQTARITSAIYFQAFRLWRKKCPFYPHPKPRTEPTRSPSKGVPIASRQSTVSSGVD